jgi:hypothetical protein
MLANNAAEARRYAGRHLNRDEPAWRAGRVILVRSIRHRMTGRRDGDWQFSARGRLKDQDTAERANTERACDVMGQLIAKKGSSEVSRG